MPYKTIPYQFYCAFLEVKGDRAEIKLTYQKKRFDREQIIKAKRALENIVKALTENPDNEIRHIIKGE